MRKTQAALSGLCAAFMLATAGCTDQREPLPDTSVNARLLSIATTYQQGMNVLPMPAWAMTLCIPTASLADARESRAEGGSGHARKLYKLYTNDASAYFTVNEQGSDSGGVPSGFSIVKESWSPKQIDQPSHDSTIQVVNGADGQTYTLGEQSHLFVMYKDTALPPEETDNGWLYGIVEHDGSAVIESGRIESCMKCHSSAGPDRLFGLSAEDREAYGRFRQ